MRLDLSDWAQRHTYFIGRYYELGVGRVLDAVLEPGDRFVDVGANIGMITLHARSLVSSAGLIDCFEPNPECIDAIIEHLQINDIKNVVIHKCALSDEVGTLSLKLTSSHSGTATFGEVDDVLRTIPVKICVGDDLLAEGPPVNVMKIDVEGFEMRVIKGLSRTLNAHHPVLITELIDELLRRGGSSSAAIHELLNENGYIPYGIGIIRKGFAHRLTLVRRIEGCNDVVWTHPQNKRSERLSKFVA
jgi:FkbM family methyltransferase